MQLKAQDHHFVFIQTQNEQPFYVKYNKEYPNGYALSVITYWDKNDRLMDEFDERMKNGGIGILDGDDRRIGFWVDKYNSLQDRATSTIDMVAEFIDYVNHQN